MIVAALQSPNFLFRSELGTADGDLNRLNGDEIATALAFFLTGAPPDEILRSAARGGALATADERARQARRLFDSPAGRANAARFVTEWLDLERVSHVPKDPTTYPGFTPAVRASMLHETETFVVDRLAAGATLPELLTAPTTISSDLQSFYGAAGPPVRTPDARQLALGPHAPERRLPRPPRQARSHPALLRDVARTAAGPRHRTTVNGSERDHAGTLRRPRRDRSLPGMPHSHRPGRLRLQRLRRHRPLAGDRRRQTGRRLRRNRVVREYRRHLRRHGGARDATRRFPRRARVFHRAPPDLGPRHRAEHLREDRSPSPRSRWAHRSKTWSSRSRAPTTSRYGLRRRPNRPSRARSCSRSDVRAPRRASRGRVRRAPDRARATQTLPRERVRAPAGRVRDRRAAGL